MEQLKIIFEIVATGCITTFVYYVVYQPNYLLEKDMKTIDRMVNTLCMSLFSACIIIAFMTLMLGLTGHLEKTETIKIFATFLINSFLFVVFGFSFSPPKIWSKLASK